MDFKETIERFRRGLFDVDCQRMVLKQRSKSVAYQGVGYIKESSDGVLRYKIYVTNHDGIDAWQAFFPDPSVRPGRILGEDSWYDLTATTMDGTRWVAERLFHPAATCNGPTGAIVLVGQINTLMAKVGDAVKSTHECIYFFDELDVPLYRLSEVEPGGARVLDTAEFTDGTTGVRFSVRCRAGSGETVVDVSGGSGFSDFYHVRVQEAIQYVTSTSVAWRARCASSAGGSALELSSYRHVVTGSRFWRPVWPKPADPDPAFWDLFMVYLRYVDGETPHGWANSMAYYLSMARDAAAGPLDAEVVGVSVAVEAIASLLPASESEAERAELKKFQQQVLKCVDQIPDAEEFVPRMKGLVRIMATRRPKDTLQTLSAVGAVDETYIKPSIGLRNKFLHASATRQFVRPEGGMQEIVDTLRKAESLLHQLVFHVIEYAGSFTDCGADPLPAGIFPTRHYPFPVVEQPAVTGGDTSS